ncbi:hypothetical protein ACVWWR_004716 [Bradyrhizobium sp. LM3.2]
MPLRLDNAKGVAHMPTAGVAKNKSFEPRFKIDHAASRCQKPDSQNASRPERHQIGKGGRDHLGILGEIKSVHPGEIIGIRTLPVSMAMMDHHLDVVARTRPGALLVADMPFLSFHLSSDDTIRNAGGALQHGADAVKLEGGGKRVEMIRALVSCEIPVMGHLGLTPQSVKRDGWLQGTRSERGRCPTSA